MSNDFVSYHNYILSFKILFRLGLCFNGTKNKNEIPSG